jgi:hypothetical protein
MERSTYLDLINGIALLSTLVSLAMTAVLLAPGQASAQRPELSASDTASPSAALPATPLRQAR